MMRWLGLDATHGFEMFAVFGIGDTLVGRGLTLPGVDADCAQSPNLFRDTGFTSPSTARRVDRGRATRGRSVGP